MPVFMQALEGAKGEERFVNHGATGLAALLKQKGIIVFK